MHRYVKVIFATVINSHIALTGCQSHQAKDRCTPEENMTTSSQQFRKDCSAEIPEGATDAQPKMC